MHSETQFTNFIFYHIYNTNNKRRRVRLRTVDVFNLNFLTCRTRAAKVFPHCLFVFFFVFRFELWGRRFISNFQSISFAKGRVIRFFFFFGSYPERKSKRKFLIFTHARTMSRIHRNCFVKEKKTVFF